MFKKSVVVVAVILSAAMFTVKAQMFMGGSLGFDLSAGKSKSGSIVSEGGKAFGFNLTPKFGYYMNDKLAIGGQIGIGIVNSKNGGSLLKLSAPLTAEDLAELLGGGLDLGGLDGDGDIKTTTTTFNIAAFGRYHLVDGDNLSLIMEGTLGFTSKNTKATRGKTTVEGDPTSTIGLSVMPVLSYSLTEKLSLEASSDFLRFGFSRTSTKYGEGDAASTDINSSFGFGANSPTGLIQLGLICKF